jgi:hypothetical protein
MRYPNDEYEPTKYYDAVPHPKFHVVPIEQYLREQARSQAYEDLAEMNRASGVYDAWILTPSDKRFLKSLRIEQ